MTTTVPTPSDSQDGARRGDAADLRERLAAIEHERWADWQRYMHGQCRPLIGAGDALVIPEGLVERWERQIATPYADLSETEKDSDRQQVDRYWPLVADLLAAVARLEAEKVAALDQRDRAVAAWVRWIPAAVDQTAPSSPLATPHTADGGEAGVVEGAGGSEAAEGDEPGWYVPAHMEHCPRCGDTNFDDKRLCITCTHGDDGYRDGQYRDGWRTNG